MIFKSDRLLSCVIVFLYVPDYLMIDAFKPHFVKTFTVFHSMIKITFPHVDSETISYLVVDLYASHSLRIIIYCYD